MDQLNLKNIYEIKLLVAMLPKPYLGSRFVVSCPVSDVNKLRVTLSIKAVTQSVAGPPLPLNCSVHNHGSTDFYER